MIWAHTEAWRSSPEAETLLCSKPGTQQSWLRALQPSRALVCKSPCASRRSLEFMGETAEILHAGAQPPVSPRSRVCSSTSSQSASWHQKSRAISQHCTCQCLFQCLQPIYLSTVLPVTLAVAVCAFSTILTFRFPACDVSMMAWFYYLNK